MKLNNINIKSGGSFNQLYTTVQLPITCSKSTIETLEKIVEYIQSLS